MDLEKTNNNSMIIKYQNTDAADIEERREQ